LPNPPDFDLADGQTYSFGNTELRALFTPGHSPGGMSFVTGDILIAGDTLFPGGPGNTQRPDGNFQQIITSIRQKLFTLPDETRVYPGHGKPTTIGAERPHLQEWIDRGW
jgi:glyoxylase-like metal-dependent hydrolase (beta-lactamase superfamily II)